MVAWQQYWNAYNQLSPEAQVSEHQRLMAHYYTYASTTPAAPIYQVPANQQLQQNAVAWRIRVQGVAAPARANGNQGAAAPRQGRVDILEVGYRIFKVVLLFSAILLYSSFERFALVLCSALFIYFIQLRRNHARNRVQAQAAAAAAQQANNQEPHVNNNNNGENDGDNTVGLEKIFYSLSCTIPGSNHGRRDTSNFRCSSGTTSSTTNWYASVHCHFILICHLLLCITCS